MVDAMLLLMATVSRFVDDFDGIFPPAVAHASCHHTRFRGSERAGEDPTEKRLREQARQLLMHLVNDCDSADRGKQGDLQFATKHWMCYG